MDTWEKRAKSAHPTNQPANQQTDCVKTHDPAWSDPNQPTNQQTNQLTNQPNLTGSQTRKRQLTSNMDAWDTTIVDVIQQGDTLGQHRG
jgi:hypothetical protein